MLAINIRADTKIQPVIYNIMGIKLEFSLAVLFLAQLAKTADLCHALALSGGGSIGSYEAGAIWGLNHNGNPEDYAW